MPRSFDTRFMEDVAARIAEPRYSLGDIPSDIPPQAGPFKRWLLKTLVLTLNWPMKRHVIFRDVDGRLLPLPKKDGTFDDLRAALERTRDVELPRREHPFFGELTSSGWKRLHVKHIAHHLKQFGAPL